MAKMGGSTGIVKNITSYDTFKNLPKAVPENIGETVFVRKRRWFKRKGFYFSNGLKWKRRKV